jgi:non-ribosomal peptide synthetase component F
VPYNLNTCVHALVAEQAERMPDAIAVADGQGSLTYSELNAKSNQIARYLQARGVGPEIMVGICMERSVDLVVACLGVLKAGGAYVPLDPAYPIERLALMLADARVPVLVTQERLRSSMAAHAPQLVYLDTDWPCLAQESAENLPTQPSLRNLAYVIYTSGSTGKPKGVPIEHRGLLNLITWHQRAFAISAADRATQLAGPAFDASVWELWPYLAIGASVHIPDETTRVAPAHLRDWLLRQAITICFLPTPLAEQAIDMAWPTEASLRFLLIGGDQLTRTPGRACHSH